jgi:hypothetical protein
MSEPTPAPKTIDQGKMLPGLAGISLFLLFLTLVNVYGALVNAYGKGALKLGVLCLCTILVAGIYAVLRMKRWGWAILSAGTILLSAGYFYEYRVVHSPFFIIQGLLMLVFFLYLIRPEVRDRMV